MLSVNEWCPENLAHIIAQEVLFSYRLDSRGVNSETCTMNRPPPYFPQNQLSPPDENRYRKFKMLVGGAIVLLALILIGAGVGVYYLIRWLI